MKRGSVFPLLLLTGCLAWSSAAHAGDPVKRQKAPVSAQQTKEVFVCPMHPEVTSNKAGKCAKCGMALEKRTTVSDAAKEEKTCDMKKCGGKCCGGKGKAGSDAKTIKGEKDCCSGKR